MRSCKRRATVLAQTPHTHFPTSCQNRDRLRAARWRHRQKKRGTSMKILWYLPTHGDGRYLATSAGSRCGTFPYIRQIAKAVDEFGYESVLIPTGSFCESAWVVCVFTHLSDPEAQISGRGTTRRDVANDGRANGADARSLVAGPSTHQRRHGRRSGGACGRWNFRRPRRALRSDRRIPRYMAAVIRGPNG
jgi:hypothetical protein